MALRKGQRLVFPAASVVVGIADSDLQALGNERLAGTIERVGFTMLTVRVQGGDFAGRIVRIRKASL